MKNINLIDIGKQAILTEINELKALFDRINIQFEEVVHEILKCKGKLVVVGIGKSAHIANKMVATFNSTGTVSQFLHASEAIHGDLGLLKKEDVVICISNSGNSPEIVALAPLLKQNSSALIAMTGNIGSQLAKEAHHILDCSVSKEACPNQLAPTSSTTVQMAMGDALAVALMECRGFNSDDFARCHPGGALGKNLTWTVEKFLSDHQPQLDKNASIKEVIISISASKLGISVVCENEVILGVITDGDLRRMLLNEENISHLKAIDIMSTSPKCIDKNELAKTALNLIRNHNIGQLVVTSEGKYTGIVSIHDLINAGIE